MCHICHFKNNKSKDILACRKQSGEARNLNVKLIETISVLSCNQRPFDYSMLRDHRK